jgi:hypothetical protein
VQPFKIYYRDRREPFFYTGEGPLPSGWDTLGVYGVVYPDDRSTDKNEGAVPLVRFNFYLNSYQSGWSGCDTWGEVKDHIVLNGLGERGLRLVLFGIQGRSDHFDSAEKLMWEDPDFGRRSVTHRRGIVGDS